MTRHWHFKGADADSVIYLYVYSIRNVSIKCDVGIHFVFSKSPSSRQWFQSCIGGIGTSPN